MDISDWISVGGVIVAVIAAGIAGWQAWEARKARTDSAASADKAASSAETAAEAQATLAAIEEKRVAQQRRMVDVEWQRGNMFTVTNRTGETVTSVTVEGSGEPAVRILRGGSWDEIADQDSVTYMGESGQVLVRWYDERGERQSRTLQVRKGDK